MPKSRLFRDDYEYDALSRKSSQRDLSNRVCSVAPLYGNLPFPEAWTNTLIK